MLVEIIIISLIVSMVSLAVLQVTAASLKGIDQTSAQVAAGFLTREEMETLRAVADEDWHTISYLTTSSANTYFTTSSAGKWIVATGTESVTMNGVTYTRSFYASDVYRSTTTDVVATSGGYYDPSTMKAMVQVSWTDLYGGQQRFTEASYRTRVLNDTFFQTDWSGGPTGETVITTSSTNYATSTNTDISSTVGSVLLQQQ